MDREKKELAKATKDNTYKTSINVKLIKKTTITKESAQQAGEPGTNPSQLKIKYAADSEKKKERQ